MARCNSFVWRSVFAAGMTAKCQTHDSGHPQPESVSGFEMRKRYLRTFRDRDHVIPASLRPNISFLHFLGYGPAARNDSLLTGRQSFTQMESQCQMILQPTG